MDCSELYKVITVLKEHNSTVSATVSYDTVESSVQYIKWYTLMFIIKFLLLRNFPKYVFPYSMYCTVLARRQQYVQYYDSEATTVCTIISYDSTTLL